MLKLKKLKKRFCNSSINQENSIFRHPMVWLNIFQGLLRRHNLSKIKGLNIMIRIISFVLLMFWLTISNLFANDSLISSRRLITELLGSTNFVSLEHKRLGDQLVLRLPSGAIRACEKKLELPNSLKLSYGEIIMFAGDFFGEPSITISSCPLDERQQCFQKHFAKLANKGKKEDTDCNSPFVQTKQLNQYFTELNQQLEEGQKGGITEADFYSQHALEMNEKFNRLTCGGSLISDLFPFGNYLKLAEVNFDHFLPDAPLAYKAGHDLALATAIKAHKEQQQGKVHEAEKLLELAYAQNAFANHFLTDSFAAGHMRTPRRAIHDKVELPAILTLLLSNLMHDEDNRLGLNVVNAEGNSWKAYGDDYLSLDNAEIQRLILTQAIQRSADAVYDAFLSGKSPQVYSEMNLIPDLSKLEQLDQTSPLFKVEEGILLKREKNKDPADYNWTSLWNGLITLLEFNSLPF